MVFVLRYQFLKKTGDATDSNQLCARKFIPTTKKHFGICQLNEDIMAASSWSHSCVDIIDGYGRVLATIGEDPLTFEIPYMLCCTGNAEIIVIDRGNKLTCFEQTGKVIFVRKVGLNQLR
jgi:hypothetical protein